MKQKASSAFLMYGFRPFYLVASAFAFLQIPTWIAQYSGLLPLSGYFGGSLGHGHEMLFGFTIAVITGFLLTAARNWTGRETLAGPGLGALVLIWIAGRVLIAFDLGQAWWVTALVDILFLPLTALAVARPILATGNKRNIAFPVLLLILAAVNTCIHAGAQGIAEIDPDAAMRVGFGLVSLIVIVLGGRVIPFFSRNALPDSGITAYAPLDLAAILSAVAVLLLDLSGQSDNAFSAAVFLVAGGLHLARSLAWKPWKVLGNPMLWVLHLGYSWIGVYFLLRGISGYDHWQLSDDVAIHALTVGAIGTMTLGMMCRTARGHSGLPIKASGIEVLLFVTISLAAASRVIPGLIIPDLALQALWASSVFWAVSHALYLTKFAPILVKPGV